MDGLGSSMDGPYSATADVISSGVVVCDCVGDRDFVLDRRGRGLGWLSHIGRLTL